MTGFVKSRHKKETNFDQLKWKWSKFILYHEKNSVNYSVNCLRGWLGHGKNFVLLMFASFFLELLLYHVRDVKKNFWTSKGSFISYVTQKTTFTDLFLPSPQFFCWNDHKTTDFSFHPSAWHNLQTTPKMVNLLRRWKIFFNLVENWIYDPPPKKNFFCLLPWIKVSFLVHNKYFSIREGPMNK